MNRVYFEVKDNGDVVGRRETKLGRLIANREMSILKKANEIMSKL